MMNGRKMFQGIQCGVHSEKDRWGRQGKGTPAQKCRYTSDPWKKIKYLKTYEKKMTKLEGNDRANAEAIFKRMKLGTRQMPTKGLPIGNKSSREKALRVMRRGKLSKKREEISGPSLKRKRRHGT